MKVLQVISGMGLKAGGPTACTYQLLKGIQEKGLQADLLTFDTEDDDEIISRESFMKILTPPRNPRFGYSKKLKYWLEDNKDYDLYHINGLWQYMSHATALSVRKEHKPYVISPHGMLYPEGLKKSGWVKKVSLALFQRKDLRKATALHATSPKEMMYLRAFGLTQPIAVIPNAINVGDVSKLDAQTQRSKRKIGFLGRLAPIKNLELLIEAWANSKATTQHAELVIIGDGDDSYVEQLKLIIKNKKLDNIFFTGFLTGKVQEAMMQQLSYLVLPSKSENFGMVVTEALARQIPVIASKGTPWKELNTHRCGWWIDSDLASLSNALEAALNLDETQRLEMGINGRVLVENKYSKEAVSKMMITFYKWILSETKELPPFVNIRSC